MRVIHIIPSAFEYFDDIRSQAFSLLEELHKLGVENEAVTLQYGQHNRATKKSIQAAAPEAAHNYLGDFDINSVIKSFADFDVVHLHCPFFGAAGKILRWKKLNPDIPLVVTYYRAVRILDLMSLFIRFYNAYYLPKIFKLADAVVEEARPEGAPSGEEVDSLGSIADRTLLMYNNLRV